MFVAARRDTAGWSLATPWGHEFRLPCKERFDGEEILFGTLGTGRREKVRGRVTDLMAELLASLRRDLILIDVRRNGTGGQGSWSPRELASQIPGALPSRTRYSYVHLPVLAPSIRLLDDPDAKQDWRRFRDRYGGELSGEKVEIGQAFIEATASEGGLAIFLCSEPYHPEFDALPFGEQNAVYCHRFHLARQLTVRLRAAHPRARIARLDLDLADFAAGRLPRRVGCG